MVAITEVRTGMARDDFMQRVEERFELIDGEIVPMTPSRAGHDIIKRNVYDLLRPFVLANHLGELFFETTFTVSDFGDPNWVKGALVPDVMFFAKDSLTEYRAAHPSWRNYPFALIPELVIKVQSEGDSFPHILRKVAYALSVGVKAAWVVNQPRQSLTVYDIDSEPLTFSSNQTLDSDLLPGWKQTIRDLFVNIFEVDL